MIFEPTGAIVASPTFSLPESIEGDRNWDYRCVFVRESSFALYALLRIGFKDEATAFMNFLEARFKEELQKKNHQDNDIPPLRSYYSIHGEHHIPEEIFPHLSGIPSPKYSVNV
jgi:GH15 family glucan-1,4-alpha-glucosidase